DTDRWVQGLSSDDPEVREASVEALVKAGPSAVPALARLLRSPDAETRGRAETILMRMGLPVVPLLEGMEDPGIRAIARSMVRQRAKEYLKDGGSYTVDWSEVSSWEPSAVVETGTGGGHGFTLDWGRLRPGARGVEVLEISYDQGRKPYSSKWPPDTAPVTAKSAVMTPADYRTLLAVMTAVGGATISKKATGRYMSSTLDFYSYTNVAKDGNRIFADEFAGYRGTLEEPKYAKVLAMTNLVEATMKTLDLKDHVLDDADRSWVSQRFIRDWNRIKGEKSFYWWVQERLLIIVGAAGDGSALPLLGTIIREGDPKDRKVYYAINAATRLLGKDVRGEPVEEMDVEAVRTKLLPLLPEREGK
ncbi:MAG TPA: HEAT repeat domain-containing protein, partial [Planctomycetota bacterium]|nr:HEAT repeat domain-containing protein [Planctomycetota bacterium]